jgi:hypothetical protein
MCVGGNLVCLLAARDALWLTLRLFQTMPRSPDICSAVSLGPTVRLLPGTCWGSLDSQRYRSTFDGSPVPCAPAPWLVPTTPNLNLRL